MVVPFPEGGGPGDLTLRLKTTLDGKSVATVAVQVSTLLNLSDMLNAVTTLDRPLQSADLSRSPAGIERATFRDHGRQLKSLADGEVPETDVPAARLAEECAWIVFGSLFDSHWPGDFRVTVPTAKDRYTPCRLLVPSKLDEKKPVPLVVALHGAGGSENLFFEGYGNGRTVKECEKRGWLLVAPAAAACSAAPRRSRRSLRSSASVTRSTRERVFLVGHSLGAAQAVELVQQHPGRFAAAACLGGGGRVRKPEAFAELPLFVGVGSKDFALRGAKALHKSLAAAGAKRATFREYPDLEHLLIVREALPDVFAGFDEAAR